MNLHVNKMVKIIWWSGNNVLPLQKTNSVVRIEDSYRQGIKITGQYYASRTKSQDLGFHRNNKMSCSEAVVTPDS